MANDEAQIRALLDEFTRAIRSKDAAGAIATLAKDVVAFDLAHRCGSVPKQPAIPPGTTNGSPRGRDRSFLTPGFWR